MSTSEKEHALNEHEAEMTPGGSVGAGPANDEYCPGDWAHLVESLSSLLRIKPAPDAREAALHQMLEESRAPGRKAPARKGWLRLGNYTRPSRSPAFVACAVFSVAVFLAAVLLLSFKTGPQGSFFEHRRLDEERRLASCLSWQDEASTSLDFAEQRVDELEAFIPTVTVEEQASLLDDPVVAETVADFDTRVGWSIKLAYMNPGTDADIILARADSLRSKLDSILTPAGSEGGSAPEVRPEGDVDPESPDVIYPEPLSPDDPYPPPIPGSGPEVEGGYNSGPAVENVSE
jgi:hypothetical protein